MDADQARAAADATLYANESVVAFGVAEEINRKLLRLPGPYNPYSWVAFTQSRFIEVPAAVEPAQPSSWHLRDIKYMQIRRGLLGGRKLYVNQGGAPANLGLSILHVPNNFAEVVRPLVASRDSAPALPDESTRSTRIVVPVEGHISALVGSESVELRCTRCNGSCGIEIMGSFPHARQH